ncbi:MAG: hypothetical protein ICV55_11860 [Coleofasciculus sp. C3-bin4]|nr:hypothetical protein [Coleofasciculus sp. C3-bin4]
MPYPDAFSRLKSRTRPTVPPRDTSVVKKPVEEGEPFSVQAEPEKLKFAKFDEMTELSHSKNLEVSKSVDAPELPAQPTNSMTEVRPQPNTESDKGSDQLSFAQEPNELNDEVVRSTIRLSAEIDKELRQLCQREKITKDTFLEAAYLVVGETGELRTRVLQLAKERYKQRKQVGEKRKLMTMMKKMGAD